MTDRELIELAAKAAGIEVYESTDGTAQNRPVLAYSAGGGMGTMPYEEQWNPLRDNHQAFRLAVKLRLLILPNTGGTSITVDSYTEIQEATERVVGDPCAATRRAIVRAAAEILKASSNVKLTGAARLYRAASSD